MAQSHAAWTPGPLATLGLAVVVTGMPVVLHLAGQGFGIATALLLASVVAVFAAPAVPVVLLFSCLFQNLFVAFVSPAVATLDQLNMMRGYNFIVTAVMWVIAVTPYWTARARFDRKMRAVMDATTVALLVVAVYFILGLMAHGGGALVYLRNIVSPILMFQIFALIAYRHCLSLTTVLTVMAVGALAYGYLEFVAHDGLHAAINADTYLTLRAQQDREPNTWVKELHETGRVIRSYLDLLVIDFLNTPLLADWGLRFYRILGPNFHFISYAYGLAVFSIVLFAAGRWWYALLALPMLLIVGSKGALMLVVLVIAGLTMLLRLRGAAPLWIFAAVLLLYVTGGVLVGIHAQDYHVIGFIGGVKGFLANPIGRGIGVGGNLSLDMSAIDWSRSQYLGHTDIAVESAIGVLLYQMGVFGAALLALFAWIAAQLWKAYRHSANRLYAMGCFGLLTVVANGVFQEEALFAPLALGIVLAFSGLLLGRAYRLSVRESAAMQPHASARRAVPSRGILPGTRRPDRRTVPGMGGATVSAA